MYNMKHLILDVLNINFIYRNDVKFDLFSWYIYLKKKRLLKSHHLAEEHFF